jgi:predicted aspartyl protease
LSAFGYRYEGEWEPYGSIYCPVVLIAFQTKYGDWVNIECEVDSGASISLAPRSLAELLGLNLTAGDRVELATATMGTIPAYIHKVKANLNGKLFDLLIAIADTENARYLFGRLNPFDYWNIAFDNDAMQTRFTPRVAMEAIAPPTPTSLILPLVGLGISLLLALGLTITRR